MACAGWEGSLIRSLGVGGVLDGLLDGFQFRFPSVANLSFCELELVSVDATATCFITNCFGHVATFCDRNSAWAACPRVQFQPTGNIACIKNRGS